MSRRMLLRDRGPESGSDLVFCTFVLLRRQPINPGEPSAFTYCVMNGDCQETPGALVFRAVVIVSGIALIERFTWIMFPFAALILFAAWRLAFAQERERRVVEGACDVCATWISRFVPPPNIMRRTFSRNRCRSTLSLVPIRTPLSSQRSSISKPRPRKNVRLCDRSSTVSVGITLLPRRLLSGVSAIR